jgi:hypothetical protein
MKLTTHLHLVLRLWMRGAICSPYMLNFYVKMKTFPDSTDFLSVVAEWSRCSLDKDSSCKYGKYLHTLSNSSLWALGLNVRLIYLHTSFLWITDSIVTGRMIWRLNTARSRDFSRLKHIQTSCGAHPASYSVIIRVLSWDWPLTSM